MEYQIEELQTWCGTRHADELRRAYRWLTENHQFNYWPRIADWKKATEASAAPQRVAEPKSDLPWIGRMKQARAIFHRTYAESPLGVEFSSLGVFRDYEAVMVRMIYDALLRGATGHEEVLGSDHAKFLREKGRAYRASAEYQATDAYKRVHGAPFDFTAPYRRRLA